MNRQSSLNRPPQKSELIQRLQNLKRPGVQVSDIKPNFLSYPQPIRRPPNFLETLSKATPFQLRKIQSVPKLFGLPNRRVSSRYFETTLGNLEIPSEAESQAESQVESQAVPPFNIFQTPKRNRRFVFNNESTTEEILPNMVESKDEDPELLMANIYRESELESETQRKLNEKQRIKRELENLERSQIERNKDEAKRTEDERINFLAKINQKYLPSINDFIKVSNEYLKRFATDLGKVMDLFVEFKEVEKDPKQFIYMIPKLELHPYNSSTTDSIRETFYYYIKQYEALNLYMGAIHKLDIKIDTLLNVDFDKADYSKYSVQKRNDIQREIRGMNESMITKLKNINPSVTASHMDYKPFEEKIEKKIVFLNGQLQRFTQMNISKWKDEIIKRFELSPTPSSYDIQLHKITNPSSRKDSGDGVFRIFISFEEMKRVGSGYIGRSASLGRSSSVGTPSRSTLLPRTRSHRSDSKNNLSVLPHPPSEAASLLPLNPPTPSQVSSSVKPKPRPLVRGSFVPAAEAETASEAVTESEEIAVPPDSRRGRGPTPSNPKMPKRSLSLPRSASQGTSLPSGLRMGVNPPAEDFSQSLYDQKDQGLLQLEFSRLGTPREAKPAIPGLVRSSSIRRDAMNSVKNTGL